VRLVALGRTGLMVSELALGLAPIGGLYSAVSEEQARATVDRAWERGVRYFDTAPLYGYGHSEIRAGRALAERPRESFVLSTKVGRLLRPTGGGGQEFWAGVDRSMATVFDFSAAGVATSLAESIDRLKLSQVDLVLLHDPDDHLPQALSEAAPLLVRWREEGLVRAIGVGANSASVLADCIDAADLDMVLLAGRYTLLDQSAAEHLLPLAREREVAVVAAGVFNSGVLADPKPGATYNYLPAPPEIIKRAVRMKAICARFGVPLHAAAIRFPLRHPAVVSVLVGVRSPREVDEAADAIDLPIPDELWQALEAEGLLTSLS
jgi:D-threo-aldose 1-dehydrogenase